MDKIIETEGIGGRPLLCDHTGVSSQESQKHLTTPTSLEMLKHRFHSTPIVGITPVLYQGMSGKERRSPIHDRAHVRGVGQKALNRSMKSYVCHCSWFF